MERLFSYLFLRRGPRTESWLWPRSLPLTGAQGVVCSISIKYPQGGGRGTEQSEANLLLTGGTAELLKSVWLKESKVELKGRKAGCQSRREEERMLLPAEQICRVKLSTETSSVKPRVPTFPWISGFSLPLSTDPSLRNIKHLWAKGKQLGCR